MSSKNITFRIVAYSDAAGKFNPAAPLNGNEDNFYFDDDLSDDAPIRCQADTELLLSDCGCLMAVADGMGGMNAGEVASAIAVETVKEAFAPGKITPRMAADATKRRQYLEQTIKEADRRIKEDAKSCPEHDGMGSTIILAWIVDGHMTLSWCGDSRAYRYNPLNGIEPLSCDHSYVQELANQGVIRYEDTFEHPQGNIVTRSLGDPNGSARPESREFDVCDGDIILLCSDGLSGVLRDRKTLDENGNYFPGDTIEDIIAANCDTLTNCREALMRAAERADWYDNVTVILCQIMNGAGRATKKPRTVARVTSNIDNNNSNNGNNDNGGTPQPTQPDNKKKWLIWGIAALCVVAAIAGAYWAGTRSGGDQPDGITQTNDTIGKKDSTTIVAGTDITPEAKPETEKTVGNETGSKPDKVTETPVKEEKTTSSLDEWKAEQQKAVAAVAAVLKGNSGLNWLINDVTGKIERCKDQKDMAFTTTWVKQLQRRAHFIIRLNDVSSRVSGKDKELVARIYKKIVDERNLINEGTFKSFDQMLNNLGKRILQNKEEITSTELTTVSDETGSAGEQKSDKEVTPAEDEEDKREELEIKTDENKTPDK